MDRTRVAKVENVQCFRRAVRQVGSLHLFPHHAVFRYPKNDPQDQNSQPSDQSQQQSTEAKSMRESWIPYPLISNCTLRLSPAGSRELSRIRLRCRDFTFYAFLFEDETDAREVFDTIKISTIKINSVDQLLAFSYTSSTEKSHNGWSIYDPRKEFARMGISEKSKDKGWRLSQVNADYKYCPTYPATFCVPSTISDTTLKHTASFRSKARIPVLTYFYALNSCTITRSAQPNAGISRIRSPQDEKLVNAIFLTTKPSLRPISGTGTPQQSQSTTDLSISATDHSDDSTVMSSSQPEGDAPKIYGAQQTNLIIDARPSINAIANQAIGLGSENMEGYPTAKKRFMGIDNIHVMRKSLEDVVDALKDSDFSPIAPPHAQLEKSKWRKHIGKVLEGATEVAATIAIQHSHVLIHCSDGWDRTSQLSALAQLLLDPYYRTLEGFMVLIEKDWMSFGHMFRLRSGSLSHETWFEIENERASAVRTAQNNPNHDVHEIAGNAFEAAIAKAQGFFRRRNEAADDLDGETLSVESSPARLLARPDEKVMTKLKDISPIFHQFLDATYQLLRQKPNRFEFNERFLRRLFYHVYSCQYGNFLFNNERERVEAKAKERTSSVWGYFLSKRSQFINDEYDPTIDEKQQDKASYIQIDCSDIKWWHELFGRTEQEMKVLPTDTSTLESTDTTSSLELGVAENEFGTSQFGTMTTNSVSNGRTVEVTHHFARMEERRLETSQPATVAEISTETKEVSTQPQASSAWIETASGGKREETQGLELQ